MNDLTQFASLALPGESVGAMEPSTSGLYVARGPSVHLVDWDRDRMNLVATYAPSSECLALAVGPEQAYLSVSNGIEIVDLTLGRRQGIVSAAAGAPQGLAFHGSRLYATIDDHLVIFDASGGRPPRELGRCQVELGGRITVDGDLALVAADLNGLRIVDVSDPTAPKEAGVFDGPGNATRIVRAGPIAYVADYSGGLFIVDISNPKRIKRLSHWEGGIVGDVVIRDAHAFLAMGELVVLDVSDPRRPRASGSYSAGDGEDIWALCWSGESLLTLGEAGVSAWRIVP